MPQIVPEETPIGNSDAEAGSPRSVAYFDDALIETKPKETETAETEACQYTLHEDDKSAQNPDPFKSVVPSEFLLILYFSCFAVLGSCLRVYLGLLFGESCARNHYNVCVVSEQTALFLDLPANMMGSFIIGFLSFGSKLNLPTKIPWAHPSHYFQHWADLHLALRTGFCGSLTTFASWNAQMVTMIHGTQMDYGSQIAGGIFGYILGIQSAYMSLKFGQNVVFWIYHHRVAADADLNNNAPFEKEYHLKEEEDNWKQGKSPFEARDYYHDTTSTKISRTFLAVFPFVLSISFFVYFVIQDVVQRNAETTFYRQMWIACLFSPFGAILRWKLSSRYNSKGDWLPYGTLAANLMGSVVAITVVASMYRISKHVLNSEVVEDEDVQDVIDKNSGVMWAMAILSAVKIGFAGTLSTVSTYIDEFDNLQEKYPRQAKAHKYVYGTIALAWSSCAIVYGLIIWG